MTRQLIRLRDKALECVLRDLDVNGVRRKKVVTFTADMIRIRGAVMWIQTGRLDIYLSKETFDPMMAYLEAARLLGGSTRPLFGTGSEGDKPLTWRGIKTVLSRLGGASA